MGMYKIGDFDFPQRLIKQYDPIKPNQRMDKGSYTDGYGVTQRKVLAHTKTEISFTTMEMSGDEMRAVMSNIVRNYLNPLERDVNVTYWDDEHGTFKTGRFYLDPSFEFNKKEVDESGVPTKYGEMKWTFIEY